MASDHRVYIGAAASELDRKVGTVRKWERDGRLPEELRPKRDGRDRRFWSRDQIEGIKRWMRETDLRPGKGLPNYEQPSEEQIREHLRKLRQPRRR